MYRRGDVLHLPLRAAPVPGRPPRAYTVAVVVGGVYARGDGEPCYYLAPPGGMGVLIGAGTLDRLLRQAPTARPPT
jgi:hypothetical protein